MSSEIDNCPVCLTTEFIINDFSFGDCVCSQCGVVLHRDCKYQLSYDDNETLSVIHRDDTKATYTKKQIQTVCRKYDFGIDNSFVELVRAWISQQHNDNNTKPCVKVATCAMYIFEHNSKYHKTISKSSLNAWANKIKVPKEDLENELINISKNNVYDITTNDNHEDEWIQSLQNECFQLLNDKAYVIDHKLSASLKKECVYVVKQKAACIFHSLKHVATAIVMHLDPSLRFDDVHRKLCLNIKKMIYD
jgi:hypothetical protein